MLEFELIEVTPEGGAILKENCLCQNTTIQIGIVGNPYKDKFVQYERVQFDIKEDLTLKDMWTVIIGKLAPQWIKENYPSIESVEEIKEKI